MIFHYRLRFPKGYVHDGSIDALDREAAAAMVRAIHPNCEVVNMVASPARDLPLREQGNRADGQSITDLSDGSEVKKIRLRSDPIPLSVKTEIPDSGSRSASSLLWLHGLLALLGLYNMYKNIKYYVVVWRSLHDQGIGHLYLASMTVFGSWFLGLAFFSCFLGNFFLGSDRVVPPERSAVRFIAMAAVGAGLSLIFPGLIQTGFFIVIVWIRDLL